MRHPCLRISVLFLLAIFFLISLLRIIRQRTPEHHFHPHRFRHPSLFRADAPDSTILPQILRTTDLSAFTDSVTLFRHHRCRFLLLITAGI